MANMNTIRVRKSGNLLELSPADELLRRALEPQLTYRKLISLFGREAYNSATGDRRSVRCEYRRLYGYDSLGRMLIPVGFLPRVRQTLGRLGYGLDYENLDPPRLRPDCYTANWDNVFRYMQLRHGQDEFLVAVDSNERGLFSAPPGFGKSTLISAIGLLYPHAKIHVVTTRIPVVRNLFQELHKLLPSVGQVGGGRRLEGRRVMVYSVDSAHHSDGDADILIADEAHEMATDSRAAQLARYINCRCYGLSATTEGRFDNADLELESFFGPVVYRMQYQEAQAENLVVPIRVIWRDVIMDQNPCSGMHGVAKKRWGVWRNGYRNECIARAAREFDGDSQTLILVDTIEHAVYLREFLPDYALVYAQGDPNDRETYVRLNLWPSDEPLLNDRSRDELRKQFEAGTLRKVIATGCWSTGVNFCNLEVLIRADAGSSKILSTQIPGRVCRTAPGKTCGFVLDFSDRFDRGMLGRSRKRKQHYVVHGWEQIDDDDYAGRHRLGASTAGLDQAKVS